MPRTDRSPGPCPIRVLRGLLRPVVRALVMFGWMWLPGVPPQEVFGAAWPYRHEDPMRPVRADKSSRADLSGP
ncbi:hypothetical protein ACSNOK_08165 [Streptomyces sp. URMC 126]|uniref:hypothetical protein n=1 Tax=Streptomyces sp. URMC 126 TaxID=3423401 RepID=UPI003F1ABCCB